MIQADSSSQRAFCLSVLVSLLLASFILFGPLALGDVLAAETVLVGVYDNDPLVFKDESGGYQGLSIDILRSVAKAEGWQLQFVEGSWSEGLQRLDSGSIDLLAVVADSEERRRTYDFNTVPLITNWGLVFSRPDLNLESLLDLQGLRVALLDQDIHAREFRSLVKSFGMEIAFSHFNSYEDVLLMVQEKKADAGVVNRLTALRKAGSYQVRSTSIIFNPVNVHFAAPKGRSGHLLAAIDRHLERFKAEQGSIYYRSLYTWFGVPLDTGLSKAVIIGGALLLVFVLAGALCFIVILRWQVRARTAALHDEVNQSQLMRDNLVQRAALFREVFNHMSNGVAIYEPVDGGRDFIIKDINPAGASICKVNRGEVIGKPVGDVSPGIRQMGLFALLQSVYESGLSEKLPLATYKDEHLNVLVENYISKLPAGEVIAVYDDITEKKRYEDILKQSLARYSTLFNASRSVILLVDPETSRLVDANPAACDFYGYPRDELLRMSLTDIEPVEDDQLHDVLAQSIRTGNGVKQTRHRLKNGELREVEVQDSPMVLDDRPVVCSIISDISSRIAAERKLVRARDEWTITFDAIPDMILILDSELRIVRVNRSVCTLFEKTFDDLIGQSCQEAFGCDDIHSFARDVLPEARRRTDIRLISSLGRTFELTCVPVLDDRQRVEFLVVTARDITEQKQLEEELFQSQKMEAIGTLAGGVAHDFNNILSAIIGFSEIAKMELPTGSKAVADIDEVISASKRAADLVKQILTFSRKDGAVTQPLQPHLIVKESLKLLRSSLPATIIIKEHTDPDCGFVEASATHLHQLMMNLCTNAVHAMDNEKGTLNVDLRCREVVAPEILETDFRAGDYMVLTVADDGRGMDEGIMERIFEPYFTTKEIDRGTGLGLAVVHGIVRDCKGYIRVESTPGKGSLFRIYLPLAPRPEEFEGEFVEPGRLPTGSECILVIDDEAAVAAVNCSLLEKLGYHVVTEQSGPLGLQRFLADPDSIDLVITDQTMPGMTGMELASDLLNLRPGLPIILCTGYSSQVDEAEALAHGIRAFLMKPVDMRSLARTVRDVIDGQA